MSYSFAHPERFRELFFTNAETAYAFDRNGQRIDEGDTVTYYVTAANGRISDTYEDCTVVSFTANGFVLISHMYFPLKKSGESGTKTVSSKSLVKTA